uniref:Uncharacterized protein n=1 Tax=Parascaris univalens TaxID=6257 RepID=A0A915BTA4_PARUN
MLRWVGRVVLVVTVVTNLVHLLLPASAYLQRVETVNENRSALPLSEEDESSDRKQVLKRNTIDGGRSMLDAEESEGAGAKQRYRGQENSATNSSDAVPYQHSTKWLKPGKLSADNRFLMNRSRRDKSNVASDKDERASKLILENSGKEVSKLSENRVPHKDAVPSIINSVDPDYWRDDVWPYLRRGSARRNGRIRYLSPTVTGKKGVKENGTKKSDKKWWHNERENPQSADDDEKFEWEKSLDEAEESGNEILKKMENLAAEEEERDQWSEVEYEREKAHGKDHREEDRSNDANVENGIEGSIRKWHFRDAIKPKI